MEQIKGAKFIKGFFEKKFQADPHISGFAPSIFFKFCIMKGAKKYMKMLLMGFWKKFLLGVNGPFLT